MIPSKPRAFKELSSRQVVVHRSAIDRHRVIVGVACKTPVDDALLACLNSIAQQNIDNIGVVLLLDGLDGPDWVSQILVPDELEHSIWLLTGHCGSPSRARNALLDFIEKRALNARWFVRLDADDTFVNSDTLKNAIDLGEREAVELVLCGNKVSSQEGIWLKDNPVYSTIKERFVLLQLLKEMSDGTANNELPSCNLVMRLHCGYRYPDMSSAEDHWLVASTLFFQPERFAILEGELLVNYHVSGRATMDAKEKSTYGKSRSALYDAARIWEVVYNLPGRILGFGQEGVLRVHNGDIIKHYYPTILEEHHVSWLSSNLHHSTITPCPTFEYDRKHRSWISTYVFEETDPFLEPNPKAVRQFLTHCLEQEIVCANIKRSNFRVRKDGSLVYIDVGKWIIPMNVSYFLDSAARLYSIGVLGNDDEELQRRTTDESKPQIWKTLSGFEEFYGDVVTQWATNTWKRVQAKPSLPLSVASEVTLLIKTCAMDSIYLSSQVRHIVDQLSSPRSFETVVLLIDAFEGPFLREYADGNLSRLKEIAEALKKDGVIDEVWFSPVDPVQIASVNQRWFGVDIATTHSSDGVPVVPQVWAFEQVVTPFVLQADLDVMIGREDINHDYLKDMLQAIQNPDVVCVAFNIPFQQGVRPYTAPKGEYKPEVRLGLLDLRLLKSILPLPASLKNGSLDTTWYRALHDVQRTMGLRTVRGGDSRTFYIHPLNEDKKDVNKISIVRDLVGQGWFPTSQIGRWDLLLTEDWMYRRRTEDVVIVALGRNVSEQKFSRFSDGLRIQTNQQFGVIVIDDASDCEDSLRFQRTLSWLGTRMTLIRNSITLGRVENYQQAIRDVCTNRHTMILVVDQDDALLHPHAVQEIEEASKQGSDIVLAAPFRPDEPTKIYQPEFTRMYETYGGDVWIHLRSFQKKLYDQLSSDVFFMNGVKLESQIDYAMMIPMVRMANNPIYLPSYRCWHERTTKLDDRGRDHRDLVIEYILNVHFKNQNRIIKDVCDTIQK